MIDFFRQKRGYGSAEEMAQSYLKEYFENREIVFPINPFRMLLDAGIIFSFRNFKKVEGIYIPAGDERDVPIVGININRPITRQRFTAAHELCHHVKDADKQSICVTGSNDEVERFAEDFAAALLMPLDELRRQVDVRRKNGYVSFEAVLEIADYFGVSFLSCLFRIAYKLGAIDGDTDSKQLKKRAKKFEPEKKREALGLTHLKLYEDLIDSYGEALSFKPSLFALNVFQSNYIYNDSRLEGLDVEPVQVAEIVADLRLNKQYSEYCKEENEAYLSIAGHSLMYQEIFNNPLKETSSAFDTVGLNRKLFSYFPNPEFGGNFRQSNTLVIGAKFDTVDYSQIINHMVAVDKEIKEIFSKKNSMPLSKHLESLFKIHHDLTVIHPFIDGNGRTLRVFLNIQLMMSGVSPVYVKVEEKKEYLKALETADVKGNCDALFEFMFKILMRTNMELNSE